MNELDLFTEAPARIDPAEQAAFLDQACAGNPEVRRRLDVLLAGHARGAARSTVRLSSRSGSRPARRVPCVRDPVAA